MPRAPCAAPRKARDRVDTTPARSVRWSAQRLALLPARSAAFSASMIARAFANMSFANTTLPIAMTMTFVSAPCCRKASCSLAKALFSGVAGNPGYLQRRQGRGDVRDLCHAAPLCPDDVRAARKSKQRVSRMSFSQARVRMWDNPNHVREQGGQQSDHAQDRISRRPLRHVRSCGARGWYLPRKQPTARRGGVVASGGPSRPRSRRRRRKFARKTGNR